MKTRLSGIAAAGLLALANSARAGVIYDDFSSGTFNPALWEIRQDVQGQPHLDEYGVQNENNNFVFHTQQNNIADRRTYLVPTRTFTTGESFEWDTNVISREGHYGNVALIVGEEYSRGIFGLVGYNNGPQPFDELGVTHIRMDFLSDRIQANTISPSGQSFTSFLPLQTPNGSYTLYVGTFTGHNGRAHLDFDNFEITEVPSQGSLALLAAGAGLATFRRSRKLH